MVAGQQFVSAVSFPSFQSMHIGECRPIVIQHVASQQGQRNRELALYMLGYWEVRSMADILLFLHKGTTLVAIQLSSTGTITRPTHQSIVSISLYMDVYTPRSLYQYKAQ